MKRKNNKTIIKALKKKITKCTDCPYHQVMSCPDPNDSFCKDDAMIVCTKSINPSRKRNSIYAEQTSIHRVVACAIRPYNIDKEADIPDWCPL